MAVPYTFGSATAAIPLSQLDTNFATTITLGNTAIQLGNTVTTLNNMTLANVTISSGSVTITDVTASGNVTVSGGTANGVAYLNGSKVLTTGSALVFDGTNLLVGTTTAGADGISLRPRNSGGGTSSITFNRANSATLGYPIVFQNNSTDVGYITQTNTAVAYLSVSDYRLKNNPLALTDSGVFIDALKPKTWEWAQDGSKGVGFIAHEFAEVAPSSVVGEKDAVNSDGQPMYQAMQASSAEVIANLVAEIQSLRQRVAQLESN